MKKLSLFLFSMLCLFNSINTMHYYPDYKIRFILDWKYDGDYKSQLWESYLINYPKKSSNDEYIYETQLEETNKDD